MTAYVVFTRERVHDADGMARYAELAGASTKGHPATVKAYYGNIETLEGPEVEGSVIVEFPDREAAKAWYNSPAYQEARKHRFASTDFRVFIVDGVS